MATYEDIIKAALRDLNVIGAGETPAPEEVTDAFTKFQQMIDSWSAEGLQLYQMTQVTQALTGAASYSFTTRPIKVESAKVVQSGLETEFKVVDAETWSQALRNNVLWYDGGFPTGTYYLRPSPTAGSLELYVYEPLAKPSVVTETVSLPPGYERAFEFNLAVDLWPEYPNPGVYDHVIAVANQSKTAIQAINQAVLGDIKPQPTTTQAA